MNCRPILFGKPMVRALLAGTKMQTRRVVKPMPPPGAVSFGTYYHPDPRPHFWAFDGDALMDFAVPCPYGQSGDRLWVRESWQYYNWTEDGEPIIRFAADESTHLPISSPDLSDIWATLSDPSNYAIHGRACDQHWRPSIHMPRWASRITLEITGVRVERLQDISPADCEAEGVQRLPLQENEPGPWYTADVSAGQVLHSRSTIGAYHKLWGQINGPSSWAANPWVWVMEFKCIKGGSA